MLFKITFALMGFIAIIQAKTYENFKVYSVTPTSEEQVQILRDLQKSGYDFWTDAFSVGNDVRIMVEPDQDLEFVSYARSVGFNAELRVPNVQKLIDDQLRPAPDVQRNTARLGSFSWNSYHTLAQIHAWLDELEELYPDVVSTVVIGTTHGGRQIKGVIINYNSEERGNNPLTAMMEGGIHAREWISPATVTWVIKEFLTSTDPEVMFLARQFVWHIFPVINADGYVYTFSDDRMWRKNRNPDNFVACPGSNTDIGNGIDLNRNFDFLWMTTGASANPCSNTYAGPSPASELETIAVSNYVQQLKSDGNFLYYFAFHSFSQMTLIPFSHVRGFGVLEAENYADLYEIAIRGAERLEARHGTQYSVGTSAEILYEVSGSSFDWVKGVAEIPIVYLFELRDLGEFGFMLPADQIISNNEEIMECLLEMDRTTRKLRYYNGTPSVFASVVTLVTGIGFLILFQ